MQDKILILSRCLKVKSDEYEFHFKGYFQGNKIDSVRLIEAREGLFHKGHDYLLWVTHIKNIDQVLFVKLIKHKKIG